MERTSHTSCHTTRGSKTLSNREKEASKKLGINFKFSPESMKFVKKIRTRKRRHFDKTEIPAI